MMKIGILNGPNLSRLGKREPEIYGKRTLKDLEVLVQESANSLGVSLECFQSNHEGELIDQLEAWQDAGFFGIVFNPGAFTHTSIALHDALAGSTLKVIEVHISNIYKRESFRHHSLTASASLGVISGLGFEGYVLALNHLASLKK